MKFRNCFDDFDESPSRESPASGPPSAVNVIFTVDDANIDCVTKDGKCITLNSRQLSITTSSPNEAFAETVVSGLRNRLAEKTTLTWNEVGDTEIDLQQFSDRQLLEIHKYFYDSRNINVGNQVIYNRYENLLLNEIEPILNDRHIVPPYSLKL